MKIPIKKIRIWIALGLSIFLVNKVYCQTKNLSDTLYFDSQVRFSIAANIHSPLKINQIEGKQLLFSFPMPVYDLGIAHYKHIFSNWGTEIGIHYSRVPYLIRYNIEVPENNILYGKFLINKNADYFIQYVTIPLSINKLIFTSKRVFSISGGIRLNYIAPYQTSYIYQYDINSSTLTFFEIELENKSEKLLTSFFIKLGLINMTKKNHSFNYFLLMNLSSGNVGRGNFNFNYLPDPNYGTVDLKISYIGFGLEYGYTLSKRYKN